MRGGSIFCRYEKLENSQCIFKFLLEILDYCVVGLLALLSFITVW